MTTQMTASGWTYGKAATSNDGSTNGTATVYGTNLSGVSTTTYIAESSGTLTLHGTARPYCVPTGNTPSGHILYEYLGTYTSVNNVYWRAIT